MFSRLLLSIFTEWILILLMRCDGCFGGRMWHYEPLSVNVTSSDPTKLDMEAHIESVEVGVFGVTLTMKWNYDVDNTSMVEGVYYMSTTGAEKDYKQLPYTFAKQPHKDFVKKYYNIYFYKNLEHCSNMPFPEIADVWPRDTYIFDKCVITGDTLPDFIPEGFYKGVFTGSGEVDWSIVVILKIVADKKMLG